MDGDRIADFVTEFIGQLVGGISFKFTEFNVIDQPHFHRIVNIYAQDAEFHCRHVSVFAFNVLIESIGVGVYLHDIRFRESFRKTL